MARIRTIKPEFFTSSDIVTLSPLARLLYIGLWGEADREGRMKWRPADFKLRILPGDDVAIEALCDELVEHDLVRLYGDGLAYIPTFLEHQSINPRESASRLPPPPEHIKNVTRGDASNLDVNAQRGKEGKGKEGKNSDPIGSDAGASPPDEPDLAKAAFDSGVKLLGKSGIGERQARSLIGSWRKNHGDGAVLEALGKYQHAGVTEPVSYITACLKARQATGPPKGPTPWNG